MAEMMFEGLDGGNPLAYLAALGALRTTSLTWPEQCSCLYWSNASGGWRPCLSLDVEVDREEWLTAVGALLRNPAGHTAFQLADDLTVPCVEFRTAAASAANPGVKRGRCNADFIAAFGSEMVESEANGKKTGDIADTALRTMSGAGHQHFLGSMRKLAEATEEDHLRSALFNAWEYADPGPSMRWDPSDDRRYALRWLEPSGDPTRTVRGANRLAIEALPLLPTAPVKGRLETTGFTQRKGRGVIWTWPIWTVPIGLDAVRSLLALPELQKDVPDRRALAAMGISEVFRCQRITQGKYRNFAPARPA
ncbi:MAG: hypothetical protein HY778_11550 [Betaproteobacteria bacterium]|nr:hypothetical protein [Betaproteobacteria bacterium]